MSAKKLKKSEIKITWEDSPSGLAEVLEKSLHDRLQDITKSYRLMLEHHSKENLHQLRVGLRRLKSFNRFFRDKMSKDEFVYANTLLRDLIKPTSKARDLDVVVSTIIRPANKKNRASSDLYLLLHEFNEQLTYQRNLVVSELSSEYYHDLINDLNNWATRPIWEPERFNGNSSHAQLLRQNISNRYENIIQKSSRVANLSRKKLHKLRIEAKELRYVIDSLAPDVRISKKYQNHLRILQEDLGVINDTYVADALLDQMNDNNAWASTIPYIKRKSKKLRARHLKHLKSYS